MKRLRILGLAGVVAAALAGPAAAQNAKIGFIYVGPAADFGYNTSMDMGRQYVEKHAKGVTTTAFEGIPETAEVARVMERLINSGHNIIFATSYGYLDETPPWSASFKERILSWTPSPIHFGPSVGACSPNAPPKPICSSLPADISENSWAGVLACRPSESRWS